MKQFDLFDGRRWRTPEAQAAAQSASRKALRLLGDWAHCELTQDSTTIRPSLLDVDSLLTQAHDLYRSGDPKGFHTTWLGNTLTQLHSLHMLPVASKVRTLRGWAAFRQQQDGHHA